MKSIVTLTVAASVFGLVAAGDALAQPKVQPKQPGYSETTPAKPGDTQLLPIQKVDDLALWKGSAVIGATVKDSQGKNIGKIEDLVVDSTGRVKYAVLSFGGFLGIGDKLFAVPWSAMRFDRDANDIKAVVLDVTKESLERAPSFARDKWPDPKDRQWGESVSRYWSDTSVTAAVKSKLAGEKLSTLTKVDVDTRQGVVKLNGTVDSERTKQRASELARQVNGVRQVVNNLKVQAGG
jgi:BON domain/PRC-barrel domain